VAPLFTEKAVAQGEDMNKYHFKVHTKANKNDVKKAIEHIYNVEVTKVNIQNVPHKGRAMRKTVRKPYKKAVISLVKDQKIEITG
jgi:large subunit ribosomal protein L23